MSKAPIVMISSYPPRLCGIATFCEEAREFIQKSEPDRDVLVISHTDGEGDGVFPLIDMKREDWWRPVVEKIDELHPYAVHIEHEYGLYEYVRNGAGDRNAGFLEMLKALKDHPVIIEPHTVHGRMREHEAWFVGQMCQLADVVLFKCHYQKWRLEWNLQSVQRGMPTNVMVVPHGARPDRRYGLDEIPRLRAELGLDRFPYLSLHLVGLIGWIQSNKRWDILTSMWEDIAIEVKNRTGVDWDLLAAGAMRDQAHRQDYERYRNGIEMLEKKGLAHYYEFIPRGEQYYKIMAICDFIVLPSTDETQSGTLARIIALNKPYVTTAPLEGLTAQTLESGGGLLFTNKQMLRDAVVRLCCDESLRLELGWRLKQYLDKVVSWEVVAEQYYEAYGLARTAKATGRRVEILPEF